MIRYQQSAVTSRASPPKNAHRNLVTQVVHYLREMSPEAADERYENVLRQRNLFVYKTE